MSKKIPEIVKDLVFSYNKKDDLWIGIPTELFSVYFQSPEKYEHRVFKGKTINKVIEQAEKNEK